MSDTGPRLDGGELGQTGSPLEIGQVIAGKYRIERQIGRGGMGIVLAATHLQLERLVAIKVVKRELLQDERSLNRLLVEARAAAKIRSEHVARVMDVGTLDGGSPFIVMEYLEGEDLADVLDRAGALGIEQAVLFVLQACEALAEVHVAEMVHRDLKPGNLFVARLPDGSPTLKIVDFGISKYIGGPASHSGATTSPQVLGSPFYMAPEQMRAESVDARSDIWALGAILFEMLTARTPFNGETLPEVYAAVLSDTPVSVDSLREDSPAGLDDVVQRCLDKDPANRFCDVAELAEALAPFGGPTSDAAVERITRILTNPELLAGRQSVVPQPVAVDVGSPGVTARAGTPSPASEVPESEGAAVAPSVAPAPVSGRVGVAESTPDVPGHGRSRLRSGWAWLAVVLTGTALGLVLLAQGPGRNPQPLVEALPAVEPPASLPEPPAETQTEARAEKQAEPSKVVVINGSSPPGVGEAEPADSTVTLGPRIRTRRSALRPHGDSPTISVERFREAIAAEKKTQRARARTKGSQPEVKAHHLARRPIKTTGGSSPQVETPQVETPPPPPSEPLAPAKPASDPWDPSTFGARR